MNWYVVFVIDGDSESYQMMSQETLESSFEYRYGDDYGYWQNIYRNDILLHIVSDPMTVIQAAQTLQETLRRL